MFEKSFQKLCSILMQLTYYYRVTMSCCFIGGLSLHFFSHPEISTNRFMFFFANSLDMHIVEKKHENVRNYFHCSLLKIYVYATQQSVLEIGKKITQWLPLPELNSSTTWSECSSRNPGRRALWKGRWVASRWWGNNAGAAARQKCHCQIKPHS